MIEATRGNVLLLASYFYRMDVNLTGSLWEDVRHVVLVHPELMEGPTGILMLDNKHSV